MFFCDPIKSYFRSRRDRSDSPPPQKRRAGSRDRSGPGELSRGAAPPPMSFANIRTPSPPVMTLSPPPAPSMNRSNSKEYSQRASRTSPRRSSRKSPASPRRQRYRSPSYDAIKPSRRHRSPSDEPHRSRPSPSRFRNPSGNNLPENPQIQRNSSKEPMPRRASPRSGQSRNTPERFDERSETRRVHRIPSGDGDRQRDEPGAYRDQTRMDRSSLERRERHNPSASKPGNVNR